MALAARWSRRRCLPHSRRSHRCRSVVAVAAVAWTRAAGGGQYAGGAVPCPVVHGDAARVAGGGSSARADVECRALDVGLGGGDEPVSYTHLTLPTICSV
eukprot:6438204-Prymnesium_polylepis.2